MQRVNKMLDMCESTLGVRIGEMCRPLLFYAEPCLGRSAEFTVQNGPGSQTTNNGWQC